MEQQQPKKAKQIKIPALHTKPAFNEIYVKGNRPLPVYIKHAHKVFLKHNCIIIHALTAAINKAVKLALHLMEEYPYLEQKVYTDSVPTINYLKEEKNEKDSAENNKESEQKIEGLKKLEVQQEDYVVKERSAIHIVLTKTLKRQEAK